MALLVLWSFRFDREDALKQEAPAQCGHAFNLKGQTVCWQKALNTVSNVFFKLERLNLLFSCGGARLTTAFMLQLLIQYTELLLQRDP